MKIKQLQVTINRDAVFQMMDCKPDSPAYDAVSEAYDELLPQILADAEGSCLFDFGSLTAQDATPEYPAGTKVIFVISTVGKALSTLSSELFASGDYLKAALANAMADSCLFELEQQWKEPLKQFCREHHVGIGQRLEAPYNLPMTVQKTAFEELNAAENLGLSITSGFMYDPLKSACQAFVVSENTCQFRVDHECGSCPAVNCKMRKVLPVEVTIHSAGGTQVILCEERETILAAYQRQNPSASAVCGGKGSCGKCKIRLLSGNLPITDADRKWFRETELAEGYRLSCKAVPTASCSVELCFAEEEDFQTLDAFIGRKASEKPDGPEEAHLGIAIDIGTTTLAAQLVNRANGQILGSSSSINHQRSFGADVISRIEASVAGKGKALQKTIQRDLQTLIRTLMDSSGVSADAIELIAIAGNTTMGHLLMGYSCETLGVFPFQPVEIGTIRGSFAEIIGTALMGGSIPTCDVCLIPGISTYVGGDIAAGLYACGFHDEAQVNLLVDLGTNGEMAIGNQDRILVTSTAAGPAFEGGNISWGTGSIPGAICHVTIHEDHSTSIETIRNQPPVGICGTGVIEIAAELLRQELIDETGRMEEPFFEDGFPVAVTAKGSTISFTQKDVREIQLAKSAVRAGVETLIRRYGLGYEDIGQVYLAGGMGFQMNCKAAVSIGLLPPELLDKITAVGNSSLAGAVAALRDREWQKKLERMICNSREIPLANDPDFNNSYMSHMMFGEEDMF